MSEWFVSVASMIPLGRLDEQMIVVRENRLSAPNTAEVMCAPEMITVERGGFLGDKGVFMTASLRASPLDHNEIDHFLQAVMDCGWRRGLRPKGFDPSAGELAAVNRHLEDMRQLLHSAPKRSYNDVISDIGNGTDKAW